MASLDLTARLRYLNDSAHLLATTAPATSKYLMSKCNSLMFDSNIEQSDSHKQKVCGACGTVMILGWEGKLQVESGRARRRKSTPKKATNNRVRAMVYKCESCGSKTRLDISPSPSSVPKDKSVSLSHANLRSSTLPTSNTSSLLLNTPPPQAKKRTKARKQGGLEAILARQKATDSRGSSGFGLDLLDFMKKT
jgi:RNase P subunit RPR2